jgi:hypothetical protein
MLLLGFLIIHYSIGATVNIYQQILKCTAILPHLQEQVSGHLEEIILAEPEAKNALTHRKQKGHPER